MATSGLFTLVSTPITVSSVSDSNRQQTTATITAVTNSLAGTLYYAIRTDREWTPGDELAVVAGQGDWATNISPDLGSNAVQATGLEVARNQYVGVVQDYNGTLSAIATHEFLTTSYPVGEEAPYQLNGYPQRINYQNVPLYADLMHTWGGTAPITLDVSNLPAGLSISTSGIVTGTPTTVETRPTAVTATNVAGVTTSNFNWQIYSYAGAPVTAPADGMTRKELIDSVIAYADRGSDIEIAANIDSILKYAEDRMSRMMRVRQMARRVIYPLVEGQEYYDLPSDFGGMRDITLLVDNGPKIPMHLLNPEQAARRSNYPISSDTDQYYLIRGNQLQILGCNVCGDIEISYYQGVPNLIEDTDSNWVLVNYTDIYRNCLIAEIEAFVKNDERSAKFYALANAAFDEISQRDWNDRWSGNPLQIRVG